MPANRCILKKLPSRLSGQPTGHGTVPGERGNQTASYHFTSSSGSLSPTSRALSSWQASHVECSSTSRAAEQLCREQQNESGVTGSLHSRKQAVEQLPKEQQASQGVRQPQPQQAGQQSSHNESGRSSQGDRQPQAHKQGRPTNRAAEQLSLSLQDTVLTAMQQQPQPHKQGS